MDQQETPSPREHHFYVSIAKFLFRHPDLGIVPVMDPIRIGHAKIHGLEPLILYGLTVRGLPIRWMAFAPADQPRALRNVLQEAWRDAEGLRGPPDILRVGRNLSLAAPELAAELAGIGVRVEVAGPVRSPFPPPCVRPRTRAGGFRGSPAGRRGHRGMPCRSFAGTREDHAFRIRNPHWDTHGRVVAERAGQWLALPVRIPGAILSEGLDWEPNEKWMTDFPLHG